MLSILLVLVKYYFWFFVAWQEDQEGFLERTRRESVGPQTQRQLLGQNPDLDHEHHRRANQIHPHHYAYGLTCYIMCTTSLYPILFVLRNSVVFHEPAEQVGPGGGVAGAAGGVTADRLALAAPIPDLGPGQGHLLWHGHSLDISQGRTGQCHTRIHLY